MGRWDDLKRAGAALNAAVSAATGDDKFEFRCPRCSTKTYHCDLSWPSESAAFDVYKRLSIVSCSSPVLGLGCGYNYGIDPTVAYCRCRCGTLQSLGSIPTGWWVCAGCQQPFCVNKHDSTSILMSCGRPGHSCAYEIPRGSRIDPSGIHTRCGVVPFNQVAALCLPNFVDLLETAVLPVACDRELLELPAARRSSLIDPRERAVTGRAVAYRRAVMTVSGNLVEERVYDA